MLGNCKNSLGIAIVCNKWKRNNEAAALVVLREDLCLPIKDFCPVFDVKDANSLLCIGGIKATAIIPDFQNMLILLAV